MDAVFHNHKQLLQITKEEYAIDADSLKDELTSYLKTNLKAKQYFTDIVKSSMVSSLFFVKKTERDYAKNGYRNINYNECTAT